MSLINCPECNSEISDKAVTCPNCGCPIKNEKKPKNKNSGCGCLTAIVVAVLIFGGSAVAYQVVDNGIQATVSGVSDESDYITLSEYNQIQTGMTYEEVCDIIGSKGTESAKSSSGGYTMTVVSWYGNGMAGSNATVSFTNGLVTAKGQVGLK